jgi:hypothetical protein
VHPWADVLLEEPEHDAGALAPAGQLWSTLEDLGRLARFLLGDTGDVLSADTLAEMTAPALVDDDGTSSYGLGLQVLFAEGGRLIGHSGAMPGFVSAVFVDREAGFGGAWAANTTYGGDRELLGALVDIVREAEPPVADEWRPAAPPEGIGLDRLGTWYWGPNGYGLRARGAAELELTPLDGKGRGAHLVLTDGAWTGRDGYFAGERLRFAPDGRSFELATFVFTREPYGEGPIPGGVDPRGWIP